MMLENHNSSTLPKKQKNEILEFRSNKKWEILAKYDLQTFSSLFKIQGLNLKFSPF